MKSISDKWRPAARTAIFLLAASATFVLLGTVAALWPNPLFIRMMPATGFEYGLLAAQSVLAGAYFAVPAGSCSTMTGSVGGVLGFLGIACPVCNKLLVAAFGPLLLMQYFEPLRLYVGLAGLGLLGWALWRRFNSSLVPAVL